MVRIFSISARFRAHPALVLSETEPHHFTGTIIPFSSPRRTKRSLALSESSRREIEVDKCGVGFQ